ncbi:hypothetical protein NC652_012393 [Populus alba x Populus x berolinensis]|nr:hypothetical protein NC652_012393 [Populus alba x Populus x berolinensis]
MVQGLDNFAPNLTMVGPKPLGAKKAILTHTLIDVQSKQFAMARKQSRILCRAFQGQMLDLSTKSFAKTKDAAFGKRLSPAF